MLTTSSSGPADELLFGSVDGLVLLCRSGQGWSIDHRALLGLHVSSLAFEPRSGTLVPGLTTAASTPARMAAAAGNAAVPA